MFPAVASRSTWMSGTQFDLNQHKRACAFIDNSALYKALLSQGRPNARIDYRLLLSSVLQNRTLSQARFYCSEFRRDFDRKVGFYSVLQDAGFEVKRTKFNGYRSRKRNPALDPNLNKALCTSMVWDMCQLSSHDDSDVFILVTGGEEYAEVVENLVSVVGVEVEVVFFEDITSYELMDAATSFREFPESCVIESEV